FVTWRMRREVGEEGRGVLRSLLAFIAADAATTLIAGLASAPFAIATFHSNAQYGLIANMLALPVMTFLVMPCVLLTLLLTPLGLEWFALALMGPGIDVVLAIGRWTSSLPGAVARVATINEWSLPLFSAGGLWLVIWHGKKRWLGVLAIAAAVAVAPLRSKPDVLISRDGRTVAVRGPDGRLTAIQARRPTFDLIRWLESEADLRPAGEVATGGGLRCDALGCLAKVRGLSVAIAEQPAALADDCRLAEIIIARFNAGSACPTAKLILDAAALRRGGAHLLYFRKGSVEVVTVAASRGARPWSEPAVRSQKLAGRGPSLEMAPEDPPIERSREQSNRVARPAPARPPPPRRLDPRRLAVAGSPARRRASAIAAALVHRQRGAPPLPVSPRSRGEGKPNAIALMSRREGEKGLPMVNRTAAGRSSTCG
ncbi:MAG: hypothetical protein F9K44_02155, partial [Hyphomicrobiaceae bacterium]